MKLNATIAAIFLSTSLFAQQTISKEFSDIDRVTMSTSSGDLIVKRGSTNKVSVELIHYFGDDYQPTIEKSGSTLRIKETNNNNYRSGWNMKGPKWTLVVPDETRLKFSTGSGDFAADDIKADFNINTGSGDIVFSDIKGDIDSNTGSGDLSIEGFEGDFQANTGSGDIEVVDADGDISVNCGSGEIELRSVSGAISANVGSGDITGRGVVIAGSSSFNSGSGDVEIELNSSPTASLSVNSGAGDAELDYNGNAIKGLITMKANKRRGEIKAPFDFDSVEEIEDYNSGNG